MNYGLYLPNFGGYGDPERLVELARAAEAAGWDGFFLWDHISYDLREPVPVVDPWVALAAIAVGTERIRIGTTVTPLPRRRPWKLARETVSVDRLSHGRLIVGVGTGSGRGPEWEALGEERDPVARGQMLDEGLEILCGLWSGEPFSFAGRHHRVDRATFLPTPAQLPRIPIWVGGFWPRRRPLRRAARFDGYFPLFFPEYAAPDDLGPLAEAVAALARERERIGETAPFDVIKSSGPGTPVERGPRTELVERYAEAGATWWLESLLPDVFDQHDWTQAWPLDALRGLVEEGPPRR